MPIPGGETQLKNTTLDLAIISSRTTIPTRTITVSTAAAIGATSISATASASTKVYAGSSLSFQAATSPVDRQQAVVLDDATLTTTATTVNVFPLTKAIAANSTSPWVDGLSGLLGVQEFGVQSSDTEVDTTNTLSGIGTEMALVRSGKTMSISGIQIPGDRTLETIVKRVLLDPAFFGREVYAQLTLGDGELYRGVAKLRNWSAPGNQNEVKKFSFELTFMGVTFNVLPAYLFAA